MEKKSNKVKELCEFVWHLEEKYDLLNLNIADSYIWEYIRMQFYYSLAVSIGVLTPQTKKKSLKDRMVFFLKSFKNSLTHNISTLKKYDTVFFSHSRSVKVDGEYIDIYSEYLIRELQQTQRIIDFEGDYQDTHIRKRKHNVHLLDWVTQQVYVEYFLIRKKKVLNAGQTQLINTIEQEIYDRYGVSFSLLKLVENKVKLFGIYYKIYEKVFKKVQPSRVYVTTAYYYAPIIKAARSQGIEVTELQHGIITRYHLGYSFPLHKKPLHYFPDKLVVWSESWKNIIKYPIASQHVVVDRFRYLDDKKKDFSGSEKEKDTFLVLSQAAITEKIAQKMLDNAAFFKGKKIRYKLHPGEFEIWHKNVPLNKLRELLDVEIITNEKNLYHLMALSEFQVGVFSTALYEGLEFDCKTVLLDVDGIEYMEDFINVNHPLILK